MITGVLRRYAQPFAVPGLLPAWLLALVGRLTVGANALAILLLGRYASGDLVVGSTAAGVFVLANAVGAVAQGWLIDGYGPSRVLPPVATIHAAGLVAMAMAAPHRVLFAVCAAPAGLCLPQLSASVRGMWARELTGSDQLTVAFAMETVTIEVVSIAGPLLVGLAYLVDPKFAVLASAVLALTGSLGFAASRPARRMRAGSRPARPLAGIRSRAVITCLLVSLLVGVVVGSTEVALAAYSAHRVSTASVGIYLALFAGGSVLGGLAYGARPINAPRSTQLTMLLIVAGAGFGLIVGWPQPVLVGVATFLVGGTAAPMYTILSLVLTALGGADKAAGIYTMFVTSLLAGSAAGTAVAGVFADDLDGTAGFLVTLAGTAAALSVTGLPGVRSSWQRQVAAPGRPGQPQAAHP